jgi:hypothetical protein
MGARSRHQALLSHHVQALELRRRRLVVAFLLCFALDGCRELETRPTASLAVGARAGVPGAEPQGAGGAGAGADAPREGGAGGAAGDGGQGGENRPETLAGAGQGGAAEAGPLAGAAGAAPDPAVTRAPKVLVVECPSPLPPPVDCSVTGAGEDVIVTGDVLAPGTVYVGGAVRVRPDGTIACVGCDCGGGASARWLACPDSVVAPAFVNPHDHVAYAHEPPRPATPERYEHRHDWRLGLRGHAALEFEGGAPPVARAAHELRMLLGGATTLAGGAGVRGFTRNPDLPDLAEGLPSAPADSDTFPLDDAGGLLLTSSCRYGSDHTRPDTVARYGGYLPHLGEGIGSEAENELRCALTPEFDLIKPNTAVVHALAPQLADVLELGRRRAVVVWSPRSNVSLYGDTAPVPLLLRSGVEVALGSDWLLSGSMSVPRELACARSFAERYWPGALDDSDFFRMTTAVAARAVGAGQALGRLLPGFLADVVLVRRRGLEPHSALVTAAPADFELVLRGGTALYGRASLVEALAGPGCDELEVCGAVQRVCSAETGFSLAERAAAANYPLFSCEDAPPNEPTCIPSRPDHYDGVASERDGDGDGIENQEDACPGWFDPARPADAGVQPDADADGRGDACDACPLDEDLDCTTRDPFDRDGDGVPDSRDLCPDHADPDQGDADADAIGDACDFCVSANPGTSACPLPIAALRDPSHAEHPPRHALVELALAEVTALRPDAGSARGYYLQQGLAPFSGIFVYTGSSPPGVLRGDRVALRGRYDDYYGSAQIVALELMAHEAGEPTLEPLGVAAADVADGGALGAALELMLVRVENTHVEDPNPDSPADYDEFSLAGGLRVDDLLYPELANDFPQMTAFSAITGVLGHSFDHTKLWPRHAGDLAD